MRDQASSLRNLIQRRPTDSHSVDSERSRMVTFTSGKGGVGKSVLALNIAVAAAQQGARVALIDANSGLTHIDVLCGLNGYWNFGHVLSGARTLGEVILKGPCGTNILLAGEELTRVANLPSRPSQELIDQFDVFESAYDLLVVDAGNGMSLTARQMAAMSDVTFLIATPEPTAIADAYATLKSWQGDVVSMPDLLVNRVTSQPEARLILERFAQTVATFLQRNAPTGTILFEDATVTQAVLTRQPFVVLNSESSATRQVQLLAKHLLSGSRPIRDKSFLERLRRET